MWGLGLPCCVWALSGCGERGHSGTCRVWASHGGGFSCFGRRITGAEAEAAAREPSGCGSGFRLLGLKGAVARGAQWLRFPKL